MQTSIHRMDEQQGPVYSTGNYIEYLMINHLEKNIKKNAAEMNTTL